MLLEIEELVETGGAEDETERRAGGRGLAEDEGPEPGPRPALGDPRADAGARRGTAPRSPTRPAEVPLLRQPDRSAGAQCPGDERPPGERGPVTPASPSGSAERRTVDADDASSRATIALLERGSLEVLGLLPRARTHLPRPRARRPMIRLLAVYKPRSGEAPLWDFEEGTLAAREVAAYVVADGARVAVGAPDRAARRAAGTGFGAAVRGLRPEPALLHDAARPRGQVRRIALFDVVANNADRKSGHSCSPRTRRIFVVDHGVIASTSRPSSGR